MCCASCNVNAVRQKKKKKGQHFNLTRVIARKKLFDINLFQQSIAFIFSLSWQGEYKVFDMHMQNVKNGSPGRVNDIILQKSRYYLK